MNHLWMACFVRPTVRKYERSCKTKRERQTHQKRFWHFGLKKDSDDQPIIKIVADFFKFSVRLIISALLCFTILFSVSFCLLLPGCMSLSSPQCIFVSVSAGARQRLITALACLLITADDELGGGEATVKVQQDSPAAQQHKHIRSFVVQCSSYFFFHLLLIVFLLWQCALSVRHSWEDKCETLHLFLHVFVTVRSYRGEVIVVKMFRSVLKENYHCCYEKHIYNGLRGHL